MPLKEGMASCVAAKQEYRDDFKNLLIYTKGIVDIIIDLSRPEVLKNVLTILVISR